MLPHSKNDYNRYGKKDSSGQYRNYNTKPVQQQPPQPAQQHAERGSMNRQNTFLGKGQKSGPLY